MIIAAIIVSLLASFLVALENSVYVEKVWLRPWAFRVRRYPECPPWTRHYRVIVAVGPREYRWKV